MAKEQPAVELPAAERTAVECPTPNGVVIIARDCVANNSKYSKGSVITVLRCLAWVATISVWKHEIEFGCEQVNHGFEVAD